MVSKWRCKSSATSSGTRNGLKRSVSVDKENMRSSGDTELVSSISKAADAVTAVKYLALQARALEDEQDVLRKKEL